LIIEQSVNLSIENCNSEQALCRPVAVRFQIYRITKLRNHKNYE
jgi:hypothetical protein